MSFWRNILTISLLYFGFQIIGISCANAQEQTLTFTSASDAKFFVYLNGTLQNEKSSGMVTLRGLEEKEYHLRIVIDDPFEVAVTRRIKPDKRHNEYAVLFNAVKERVYLKPVKAENDEQIWLPDTNTSQTIQPVENTPKKQHNSLKRRDQADTATRRMVNTIHQVVIEEE